MTDEKQQLVTEQVGQIQPVNESAAIMNVIERAATNPDVDVDKMERLLEMQERIFARNAEMVFNQSMVKAQTEMRPISADANNPQTRSKYASYAQLDKALRPIYTNHGFSLSFNTENSAQGEAFIKVMCIVSHVDGHSRTFNVDMPADGKGAKGGDVMTKTHATGAAMTYGMRYLLKMIFNVAIGEDDSDGNPPPLPRINAKQVKQVDDKIKEVLGDDTGPFMNWMQNTLKAKSVENLNQNGFNEVMRQLDKKAKK